MTSREKSRTKKDKHRQKITIVPDGPYQVSGSVPLAMESMASDAEGTPVRWEQGKQIPAPETYYLCRCGQSAKKPFCDDAHAQKGFDGTETASHIPYKDQAEIFKGPGLVLNDNPKFCSIARFCNRAGGAWKLIERSHDPSAKKTAIQEACDCPSGRLVAEDPNTGKIFEPAHSPSISIVEDPHHKLSGPLWVKGGVPLQGADGTVYEVRNRMTLCRCGKSKNKPFCDGSHIRVNFYDGDKSLNKINTI